MTSKKKSLTQKQKEILQDAVMEHVMQNQWEGLQELIEAITGCDMKALLSDEEKPITFMEVSMRLSSAEHMFKKMGEKKYLETVARCESTLKLMWEKAAEGKQLYLRASELSKFLCPNV